jgi:ubiquinone biosynthesis protein
VLVLENLKGTPLSSTELATDTKIDREAVVKTGLRCYMQMVFHYGFFHGDLHAGNFFILDQNKIGLIDFGVVGRLNKKTQTAIANMLLALATEDYDRLAEEYVNLAPFNDQTDVDKFARELRDVIAPYYGLTLRSVNLGRVLMNSSSVATRNHVALPTELMMFFKSIVTIEGLSRKIIKDFDFLHYALDFAMELAKTQYDPEKISTEVFEVLRDSKNLLYVLPRQIRQVLRKVNHPNFALKVDLQGIEQLPKAIDRFGIMLYWGLIIAALIISATTMLGQPAERTVLSLPLASFVGYGLAVFFGAWAYWKKR